MDPLIGVFFNQFQAKQGINGMERDIETEHTFNGVVEVSTVEGDIK